jgi:hypothetical protein
MEPSLTETAQVDAQSEEWFASYAEPANERRRIRIRVQRKRDPRLERLRRQHRMQTVMLVASVVAVGAMTACFYVILTR